MHADLWWSNIGSDFDRIIREILEEADMEREDLLEIVQQKLDELGGFVSPEGAAVIVGKKLGVGTTK